MGIACNLPLPITHHLYVDPASTGETGVLLLTPSNPKSFCTLYPKAWFFFLWCRTDFLQLHQTSFTTPQLISRSSPSPNSAQGKKPLTPTSMCSDPSQFFSIYIFKLGCDIFDSWCQGNMLFSSFPWCQKDLSPVLKSLLIPVFWEKQKMKRYVWWWSDNYLRQLWVIQACSRPAGVGGKLSLAALASVVSLGSKSFRFFSNFGFPMAVFKVNF